VAHRLGNWIWEQLVVHWLELLVELPHFVVQIVHLQRNFVVVGFGGRGRYLAGLGECRLGDHEETISCHCAKEHVSKPYASPKRLYRRKYHHKQCISMHDPLDNAS
jgi:hypothetical protein